MRQYYQYVVLSLAILSMQISSVAYASIPATPPGGDITFYNSSKHNVTAQVSTFGKFTLASHESKELAYSSLAQACSPNPTNCKALFFIDNLPVGYATMNVLLGKIVQVKSTLKVLTARGAENVVRHVTIK